MTNPIADPGHGHSPAAWTAVIIMLAGFTLATLAFCLAEFNPIWVTLIYVFAALIPMLPSTGLRGCWNAATTRSMLPGV